MNLQITDFQLKFAGTSYPVSAPPLSIYQTLQSLKLIEPPLLYKNESLSRWVADCPWELNLRFKTTPKAINRLKIQLSPSTDISINRGPLQRFDNEFMDFFPLFTWKSSNHIKILFNPVELGVLDQINQNGYLFCATDHIRPYIRKPQFSFGWDWGPYLPDFLLYKLEDASYESAYLEAFHFQTLAADSRQARMRVQADFSVLHSSEVKISFLKQVHHFMVTPQSPRIEFETILDHPTLWYPAGFGKPAMFPLTIQYQDGRQRKLIRRMVGIRSVELIHDKGFHFLINGTPIFAQGYNWIPIHSYLTEIANPRRLNRLIKLASDGGSNMLRVWGGGLYETDDFYLRSAQKGIMIWQDFPFACSEYPIHDQFIGNVKQEAEQQVARIRNYPNLVLLCGNNENEWVYQPRRKGNRIKGAELFESILPAIVRQHAPEIPYWQSSPWSPADNPNLDTQGDMHNWSVWHELKNYTDYETVNPQFVSEFGMQSLPNDTALKAIFPSHEPRHPFSTFLTYHNKHLPDGHQRIAYYLEENHLSWRDFNQFRDQSQLFQGLAMKRAIEAYRVKGCNGTLIWQFNDCWPSVSWAVVDVAGDCKLSYWLVKGAHQPCIITYYQHSIRAHSLKPLIGHAVIDLLDSNSTQIKSFSIRFELGGHVWKNLLSLEEPAPDRYIKIQAPGYLNYYFSPEIPESLKVNLLMELVDFYRHH
ncbi:MAG: hypothetical protein KBA26_04830 [Candidatus Delongbacteria bacterium]|nr:hypothetical protein [Candidatus Delongbacteria bacterium]